MKSPIQKSRPIKKFRIHRNKHGAVLAIAKTKILDGELGPGDHVIGFSSDEDILVQCMEAGEEHNQMASFFNAVEAHMDGRMTDKEFTRLCVQIMNRRFEQFRKSWEIWQKVGDLPKLDRDQQKKDAHARKLFKKLLRQKSSGSR